MVRAAGSGAGGGSCRACRCHGPCHNNNSHGSAGGTSGSSAPHQPPERQRGGAGASGHSVTWRVRGRASAPLGRSKLHLGLRRRRSGLFSVPLPFAGALPRCRTRNAAVRSHWLALPAPRRADRRGVPSVWRPAVAMVRARAGGWRWRAWSCSRIPRCTRGTGPGSAPPRRWRCCSSRCSRTCRRCCWPTGATVSATGPARRARPGPARC